MPTALMKVQLHVTPIRGMPTGLRLRAAQLNAGHPIFGPSFDRPYSIAEWSDHSIMLAEHVHKMERFLMRRGYRVERYGELIQVVLALGTLHYLEAYKALGDKKRGEKLPTSKVDLTHLTEAERTALVEELTNAGN